MSSIRIKTSRASLAIWLTFCCLAGSVFLIYSATSYVTTNGEIIAPLDDVYIHFQYARQLAEGEPYRYNTDGEFSSGATSFIYPYILAAGYRLGFTDLTLTVWAMGVGALCLLAAMQCVYLIANHQRDAKWLGLIFALSFGLSGPVAWHFMSGMETALMVAFSLATFYAIQSAKSRAALVAATGMALTRPEGAALAGLAVVYIGLSAWRRSTDLPLTRLRPWLALSLFAMLVQPALNLALTGSISASGMQAKSILNVIPFDATLIIERVANNFLQMWGEFATGDVGAFTPMIVAPLALTGLATLYAQKKTRRLASLLIAWALTLTAAVATLDTAFWHFKRYQLPLVAWLFPLAALGMHWIYDVIDRRASRARQVKLGVLGIGILFLALPTASSVKTYLRLYRVNVENISVQPLAMARWLNNNTPPESVIAVHDVGMMRYVGERATLDMVGLTTPGAADAWRNGPGAVAQFLMRSEPRPDLIAAYTTARGLNYLADTRVYGQRLAAFPAPDNYAPEDNVALAAEFQGIYQPDWSAVTATTARAPLPTYAGMHIVDALDVADLESEAYFNYTWQNDARATGFVTEVYEFEYAHCAPLALETCRALDGGRRINQRESFSISNLISGETTLLISRVHPANSGILTVSANGVALPPRWIPAIPGQWIDIATLIPGHLIIDSPLDIQIDAQMGDGYYMPYMHWIAQGAFVTPTAELPTPGASATFQNGQIILRANTRLNNDKLEVTLAYETPSAAAGDYKYFIHLYDDISTEPRAQQDGYPGGVFPPGAWLPGTFQETIVVDLTQIPAGEYQVAVGFYDPNTLQRLAPLSVNDYVDLDSAGRRLFIGSVEVNHNG